MPSACTLSWKIRLIKRF